MWKRHVPLVVAVSVAIASWPFKAAALEPAALRPKADSLRAGVAAPHQTAFPASGEVIVKFRKGAAGSLSLSAASTVTGQGGSVVREDQQLRMVVKLPADPAQAAELMAALRNRPDVAYVENNDLMQAFDADPSLGELWGLTRMNLPAAWATATGAGPGVVVAVVDTGVDGSHEDLAGRVLPGFNAIDSTQNSMDDVGHGTHVSGTIAATYNNGIGVAGIVGPANVRILPVKVLGADGKGGTYTVARGIEWAADHGAQIINLSLGGGRSNIVKEAVLYAESKGAVVVAAAGNDARDTEAVAPANVPGVVTVAALDRNDAPASFSNYGDQVDVVAPGVGILSTVPGNRYGYGSGTSMAAPHVAGLAALLKAVHPTYTRWDIQACLIATAAPVVQVAGYGYGLPMADKLLACDPTKLDSTYALKLEGPDPDISVYGSTVFSFDVKGGGARIAVKDSNGAELGFTRLSGAGVATVAANLTGLAPGAATLMAEVTDQSGAVLAANSFPVTVAPPAAADIGLALSTTDFNPAKEKLTITTRLSGSARYSLVVVATGDLPGELKVVKLLVDNGHYTGPVQWDGKDTNRKVPPEGSYWIVASTSDGEAWADFGLRLSPVPAVPRLTVAAPAVNVPAVQVSGSGSAKAEVGARVKAPGAAQFTEIGIITMAQPDGKFAAPVPLTGGEGVYEIQIRGVDPFDRTSVSGWSGSARVQYDATAPMVQLTSPAPVDGVVATNQKRLTLVGTTEPGVRVTAGTGPNTKTAAANATGLWKLDLPLQSGANSLTLSAVDAAGNQSAVQHFDVTVDSTGPVVTPDSLTLTAGGAALKPQLTRGAYGFSTAIAPQYVLSGVVSERIGKVVAGNGKLLPTVAGDSFTVDLTPGLRNGNNALWFEIYDMGGNKTRLSVAVTLDGTKPKVTVREKDVVLAPKADAGGVPQPVPATFTVTASEPLRELRVLYDNGGSSEGVAISKSGSTDGRKWTVSMTFPAADANWAIQFVGVDLAGNVGEAETRTGRRVSIDATAPELALTNSTDTLIFSASTSLTVAGTVADAGAGVKSLTVGRSVVRPNKDGSFSTRVALSEGKLTAIPVVVLDLAGNKRTETIRVLAKSKVNALTVSTRLSPERQLSITGRTDAPIRLPDESTVGVVPVTVVITDSQKVARSYAAEVKPDGSYSLNVDAAGWATGRYSITVTGGVPAEFDRPGAAFRSRTVTGSLTIK